MEKSSVRKRGSHNCYIAPVIMWNRMGRCGPVWTLRLTASAEGSPQPTDCRDVVATGVGKDLGTDGVRRSRTAILKACECSRKPAFRDQDAVQESLTEGKVFTKAQPQIARNLDKGLHGRLKDCRRQKSAWRKDFQGKLSVASSVGVMLVLWWLRGVVAAWF
jgi:hypothetical protein